MDHPQEMSLSKEMSSSKRTYVSARHSYPTVKTKGQPFHFPMVDFSLHKAKPKLCWFSPYFYSSSMGYKMCLGVDANGSGKDAQGQSVEGRYMSVYVHFMPGNFDEKLSWPFQGSVQITLKSIDGESSKDYVRTIRFSDSKVSWVGGRVAGCEQSLRGWGDPAFVLLNDLHKYKENDTVNFIVDVSLDLES